MPSGFEHSVRVQLRWRDMDMLGHLNQSVYHELLEEGRVGWSPSWSAASVVVAWDPVSRSKRFLTDRERAALS